jgi:hypothetical protein
MVADENQQSKKKKKILYNHKEYYLNRVWDQFGPDVGLLG